jgi:hypothetical protein
LLTFFAAAKKVSAAPHRGITNRPLTKQGDEKKQKAHRQKPDALQATTKRKTVKPSPAKGPKAGSFNEP